MIRIKNDIRNFVYDILDDILFEENSQNLRKTLIAEIYEYLEDNYSDILFDYYVICDSTNNEDNSTILNLSLFLKYTSLCNFEEFKFSVDVCDKIYE